jgi:hemerythrin
MRKLTVRSAVRLHGMVGRLSMSSFRTGSAANGAAIEAVTSTCPPIAVPDHDERAVERLGPSAYPGPSPRRTTIGTMTRYLMTEDLLTGNAEIDKQHESLFGLANEVLDPDSERRTDTAFLASVGYLSRYVQEHFAAEEAAMVASSFPNREQHQQFHVEFRNRIAALLERSLEEPKLSDLRRELSRAVTVLLVRHIRVEDKALAAHLRTRSVELESISLE